MNIVEIINVIFSIAIAIISTKISIHLYNLQKKENNPKIVIEHKLVKKIVII